MFPRDPKRLQGMPNYPLHPAYQEEDEMEHQRMDAEQLYKLSMKRRGQIQEWLALCVAQCARLLPEEIFKEIPIEIWNHYPLGHRLVVRRFPAVSKMGQIVVPDSAQREMYAGWVLTVGNDIDEPNSRMPHVWQSHPLTLVGTPVLFARYAGATLKVKPTQREYEGDFVEMTIGDVWGPLLNVQPEDWSAEKKLEVAR